MYYKIAENVKRDFDNGNFLAITEYNNDILNIILNYLKKYEIIDLKIKASNYTKELSKFEIEIERNFEKEMLRKVKEIISSIKLRCIYSLDSYDCEFEDIYDNKGKLIKRNPIYMNLTRNPNELTYVGIGHAMIHLLKDRNCMEFYNFFNYGEVIPIFYELLQANSKREKIKNSIIINRLNGLKKTYEANYSLEFIENFKNNPELYIYHKFRCDVYFISFYYALMLYSFYKNNPKLILNEIKNILDNTKTTIDLIELFELNKKIDIETFDKEYNLIINKK